MNWTKVIAAIIIIIVVIVIIIYPIFIPLTCLYSATSRQRGPHPTFLFFLFIPLEPLSPFFLLDYAWYLHPLYLSIFRHSPHRILATAEYSWGFKRILAAMPRIFPERDRNSYSEIRSLSHLYGNRDVSIYTVIAIVHWKLKPMTSFR